MFTEQLTATPLSDTGFPTSISAHDERQVERLAHVREGLEPYPARFFGQLVAGGAIVREHRRASTTGGPRAGRPTSAGPAASARSRSAATRSPRSSPTTRARPRNVKAAGLHGVEVHGAHGWLVGQFLSPFYNHREDDYGGERREPLPLRARDRPRDPRRGRRRLPGRPRADLRRGGRRGRHHARRHARAARGARARPASTTSTTSRSAPGHSGYLTISSMAVPEGYPIGRPRRPRRVVGDRAAVFVAGRIVDLAWRRARSRTAPPTSSG